MVLPFPKSPYFHHNTAQNDTDTLCELQNGHILAPSSFLTHTHKYLVIHICHIYLSSGPVPTRGPQHTSKGYARCLKIILNNLYKNIYTSFVKLYNILKEEIAKMYFFVFLVKNNNKKSGQILTQTNDINKQIDRQMHI